jgi:multidrug transporter EmrE-like cation transporter
MNLYILLASKVPVIILILLAASSVIAGDFFAKYWSIHQRPLFLVLTFIFYFGSAFFYTPTLLREGLVITSMIWSLISFIGLIILGLLVFNETLTLIQTIGVVIGGISLILLSI